MMKWKTWIACIAMLTMLPLQANAVKVVIDAGHGGYDRGATGVNGLYEKEVNLDISLRLEEELSRRGYETVLTRKSDYYLELQQRVDIANKSNADLFVSVHANSHHSPDINGSLVLYYDRNYPQSDYPASAEMKKLTPESKELAQYVLQNVVQQGNTVNRGIVPSSVYVIRRGQIPSILVETAFLSNSHDAWLLRQSNFRQKMAVGIANGIERYYPSLFNDIHHHWAQDSILRLAENGYVQGANHHFQPNRSMTRAEFVVLMDRIFDFSAEQAARAGEVTISDNSRSAADMVIQYSDLDTQHWAYSTIAAAAKLGMISGYRDGTFRPNQPITRAEMSVLLNRFIDEQKPDIPAEKAEVSAEQVGILAEQTEASTGHTEILDSHTSVGNEPLGQIFEDVPQGTWAYDAVSHLWQLGIVHGVTQSRFAPYRNITRAEGAVMIDRFLQLASQVTPVKSLQAFESPSTMIGPAGTETLENTEAEEAADPSEASETTSTGILNKQPDTQELSNTLELPDTTETPRASDIEGE